MCLCVCTLPVATVSLFGWNVVAVSLCVIIAALVVNTLQQCDLRVSLCESAQAPVVSGGGGSSAPARPPPVRACIAACLVRPSLLFFNARLFIDAISLSV